MFKPYCHPSKIIFSITGNPVFSCGECKRDQTGFLGFLYGVATNSENPEKILGGEKKRKGWACKNCGEPGHRAKTCQQPKADATEGAGNESENKDEVLDEPTL